MDPNGLSICITDVDKLSTRTLLTMTTNNTQIAGCFITILQTPSD